MMHEQFAVLKDTVRIGQVDFPFPDGFNFGARQHYPGRVGLQKVVLKRGAAVAYIYVLTHFLYCGALHLLSDSLGRLLLQLLRGSAALPTIIFFYSYFQIFLGCEDNDLLSFHLYPNSLINNSLESGRS